ncbi:MAG: helix-turn-helix domain-containing protein [Lacinutrix venerupis]
MNLSEEAYINLFGENLRKIRKKYNLSQEQLANDANIPINQIGRIERGEISTTISTLFFIASALNLSIKDLFDF